MLLARHFPKTFVISLLLIVAANYPVAAQVPPTAQTQPSMRIPPNGSLFGNWYFSDGADGYSQTLNTGAGRNLQFECIDDDLRVKVIMLGWARVNPQVIDMEFRYLGLYGTDTYLTAGWNTRNFVDPKGRDAVVLTNGPAIEMVRMGRPADYVQLKGVYGSATIGLEGFTAATNRLPCYKQPPPKPRAPPKPTAQIEQGGGEAGELVGHGSIMNIES